MYYSSGNYEAFARPKKPEGVDHKSAYIVGSGLAALTAACYLVRDGQTRLPAASTAYSSFFASSAFLCLFL